MIKPAQELQQSRVKCRLVPFQRSPHRKQFRRKADTKKIGLLIDNFEKKNWSITSPKVKRQTQIKTYTMINFDGTLRWCSQFVKLVEFKLCISIYFIACARIGLFIILKWCTIWYGIAQFDAIISLRVLASVIGYIIHIDCQKIIGLSAIFRAVRKWF